MLAADNLIHRLLGLAFEVHTQLGPGLLESAYKDCLGHERQTADETAAIHESQILTYLRLSGRRFDLPFSLNTIRLKHGLSSFVLGPRRKLPPSRSCQFRRM